MKIQGRDCTLTVEKDNEYFSLPYSEETVRETSKGYILPSVIGKRNREKFIKTGTVIEGCFVTLLDYSCILALFLLFFYENEGFDIYADRVFEKIVYKNVYVGGFELRAENGGAFKLRVDLESNEDSYTTSWPVNTPSLEIPRSSIEMTRVASPTMTDDDFDRINHSDFFLRLHRTFFYDGHTITIDNKTIPLICRFEFEGRYSEKSKYSLTLYFPLSTEFFPSKKSIEKLSIPIDIKDGICLEFYDLMPAGELTDINCADTVLSRQTLKINGCVVLRIRNEREYLEIVL